MQRLAVMYTWFIHQLNRPRVLGVLTLAVMSGILFAGLWPFSPFGSNARHWMKDEHGVRFIFFPPNEVRWFPDEDGLYFGDYGSIFSSGEFEPKKSGDAKAASIEIWLEPAATKDMDSILVFCARQNPLRLRIGQTGDSLLLNQDLPDEKGQLKTISVLVDHVYREGQKLLIAITSGSQGSSIYLNGILAKTTPLVRFTNQDFTGELVVGNSPLGNDTWGGTLRGIALSE
jgi:hypothetical protein